jgi:hypothetical protein
MTKKVVIVGMDPTKIDFSDPANAYIAHLGAKKLQEGLDQDVAKLNALGFEAELCLTDLDPVSAAATVTDRLKQNRYDCVLIGAGVRAIPKNFLLFEKLINIVHEHAPQARICFNSRPDDSAEAVQRWI